MNKTRDLLAKEYAYKSDCAAIPTDKGLLLEFYIRRDSFKAGWDANAERAKVLVDALKWYGKRTQSITYTDHTGKTHTIDTTNVFGSRATEALAKYRGEE